MASSPLFIIPAQSNGAVVRSIQTSALALTVARKVQHHADFVVAVAGDERQAYRLEAELRFTLAGGGNGSDAAPLPLVHRQDTETPPFDSLSPHPEMLSAQPPALPRSSRARRPH